MIRVKDLKVSLEFYQEVLGMELLQELPFTDFTLTFSLSIPAAALLRKQRKRPTGAMAKNDPDFKGYASGNADLGRGLGHIAISVPDVEKACARLETLGVPSKKRLSDGKMRNIAFALDPDGYWIEIVPQQMSLHPKAPE